MINLKDLRRSIESYIIISEKLYEDSDGKIVPWPKLNNRITIKRKKKMIIEKSTNGNVKAKRVNYIKIEIIEGGK